MTSRTRITALALLVCVGLLASCGSDSASSPSTTDTTVAASPASAGTTQAAASDIACVTDVDQVINIEFAADSTTAPLPADLTDKIDAAASKASTEIAASGAIVGVRTPEGTWTKAYGVSDPGTTEPMQVGMHTRLGSITKTFTVSLILQLAEQGKLSLDDTIDTYLDGIPNGDKVTLRSMANMTSGLASYTFSPEFTDIYFANPDQVITPDQVVEIAKSMPIMFEPGADYFYSNTNTVLLGKVIEKITGEPVADVYEKQIFEPLGLENTSAPGESPAIPEPYAHGQSLQGEAATPEDPSDATNWNPAWAYTAGELISTMDDLLTYGRALGTGQGLLDEATQAERLTSFPDSAGYGYGIGAGCADGWVGHVGEIPGYNATLYYDTTSGTVVAVQTNSDISNGACAKSPLLANNPAPDAPCSIPAARVFQAVAEALGHPVTFPTLD